MNDTKVTLVPWGFLYRVKVDDIIVGQGDLSGCIELQKELEESPEKRDYVKDLMTDCMTPEEY